MANTVDNATGYILMDYCKLGTLESQLIKAAVDMPNGTERYLPDSVLWRIFDCLVKACMAMECPPRFAPGNAAAGAQPPLPISGGYLPEVVAPGNGRQARGIVHFDMVGRLSAYLELFNLQLLPSLSPQGETCSRN